VVLFAIYNEYVSIVTNRMALGHTAVHTRAAPSPATLTFDS